MKNFNALSIRAKLILIILAVNLTIVILIGGTRIAWDIQQERQDAAQELSALTQLLGNRSSAALAFDDADSAAENLDSLKAITQVTRACVYRSNGTVMADYQRDDTIAAACPAPNQLANMRTTFDANSLHMASEIRQGTQSLGWIYLRSDLSLIDAHLQDQITFSGLALLAAALLTVLLAGWVQRIISGPIAAVTNVAKAIEEHGDHSLRAKIRSHDEIGQLARTFNAMLDALEAQNRQLIVARDEQLAASALHRSLVESTSAIPWELDLATWRFIYVGRQAEVVLGYPEKDWYQENFWVEHLHPDDRKASFDYCQSAIAQKQDHQFEYRMLAANGRSVWIHDDVQIVYKEGEAVRLQGFMFDISERKQMEEELRRHRDKLESLVEQRTAELKTANKELESFSYSVSHDLRAPLRAIDGFSQALEEDYADVIDDNGRDYIKRVRAGTQRMGELIDDLLQLSRISRQSLQRQSIDLSQLAEEISTQLHDQEPDRTVQWHIEKNLTAQGDARLLRIVLENMLNNACKYTSKTTQARVDFFSEKQGNETVYCVRDNGAGFDMVHIDKLFGAFQRLHKDSEFPGTGIGLATVQRIIRRHGGRIWAEAQPGKGASFYFTLPAEE